MKPNYVEVLFIFVSINFDVNIAKIQMHVNNVDQMKINGVLGISALVKEGKKPRIMQKFCS